METAAELSVADMPEPSSENKPRSVGEVWANVQLDQLRTKLDRESLQVADNQESSVKSRKALSDATKALKKTCNDKGWNTIYKSTFSVLLKEYQSEIDKLTSRAKFAENAFLDVCKSLDSVPDPTPFLIRGTEDAELVSQLQEQLNGMTAEKSTLELSADDRVRYEDTISRLQTDLHHMQESLDGQVHAAMQHAEQKFLEAQHNTAQVYQAREAELTHKLAVMNEALQNAHHNIDSLSSQLFETKGKLHELRSATTAQMEMAEEDMSREQSELHDLRRRCAELESRLQEGSRVSSSSRATFVELAAKDVQISQLTEEMKALQSKLGSQQTELVKASERTRQQIDARDAEIEALKNRIESLPTAEAYEELVQRTDRLRALQLEEDEVDGSDSASLEKKLMDRLKNVEGRLTKMRVSLMEKEEELEKSKQEVVRLEDAFSDQSLLVKKLEEGISSITVDSSKSNSLQDLDRKDSSNEQEAMLAIVTGQRDRFRAKVQDLEEDSRKLVDKLGSVQSELDALKADNVQLYSKIRYLQSYKDESSSSTAAHGGNEEDPSFLNKYQSVYEDMMNPFNVFNRRERNRRVNELSAAERVTLRAGQRMLGSKNIRVFVFSYVLLLHLFVFVVLAMVRTLCSEPPHHAA
mmetsp:Transcript_7381/g.22483  ORF Transcript_7381/g.22483 Transcript_7381/m.22483 type:complete len:639 (+) Transcript_7381:64-1980(+)|eukprot:CAMPEP_0198734584 /NCGR_PEP_ID=MMETSP1475-20131203/53702_1 /TAXON_ID= ORGANISM="Unidentified sp., Strain CCMP1999" /NCGR_SAMPLE_ID=MMETSP1475 /ASSEMBLY_ACC=CAM_ASM_001111 /LENGTH=638 /DNA_ID=CAMNT_0044498085 /DNA_START=56 /DNA_END=1972 /DNA_ORIENTATION=-